MRRIHTIGYEGTTAEEFIDRLAGTGVSLVIDVRERSASRKPGFSKSSLHSALAERGMGYEHWRDLGTPKPIRDLLRIEHDWPAYRAQYLQLLDERTSVLQRLAERIEGETACLLCFERDAGGCHRSLVASRLEELGLVDATVHISP